MNIWLYVRTKPVCEEREEAKEIELQEDTNMSDACIKGFQSCFLLGQLKDSDKDLNIGQSDKADVKS